MDYQEVFKIENYELQLYRLLVEELSDGAAKRLDFEELADRLGCSRSTVTRNVGKLLSASLIGSEQGKLYLK